MGDLNELVERFASIAAAEPDHNYHRSVMSVYGELPKGQLYVDAGALAAALTSLIAERDGLREAIATPEAVHANMLRGGIPMLSIRSALHLHGADALAKWDRAEAAEAQLKAAREAMALIAADLQSSIDTHEFNARHMIAEDSLQDAWKMLDMAREQFQVDANSLRIPLNRALSLDTNKGDGV